MKRILKLVLCAFVIIAASASCKEDSGRDDGYCLEDEVVFSRHNIRSPLSTSGSELSRITPYEWVDWGVEAAHLTERGGRIEQKIGEWFRADLVAIEPIDSDNTLFYSNSKQRTIKTGENFIEGFGPGLSLYYRFRDDSMDPLFNPAYPFMSAPLQEKILADMNAIGGVEGTPEEPYKGILAAIGEIADEIHYMEEVISFKESPYAGGTLEHLPLNKMSISLTEGKEPGMTGDYKLVNSIADALVLQYYETGKEFGKEISVEDVRRIGKVKTVYDEVLFANQTTAVLVSNPLVKKIKEEILDSDRKFTFLCGHDSNIATITTALGIKLPQTTGAVEFTSPIGSKIVFRKYRKGESLFVDVHIVYASVSQLRETTPINVQNPPMILPVDFEGLSRNMDGYYRLEDVIGRFDDTIAEFESLVREYDVQASL
ncbi:MAG: hypothetical protein KBS72_08085 [Bacteroidales bacterium]|nr:hypothetical protein [Candidatus Cacconaster scatequi]